MSFHAGGRSRGWLRPLLLVIAGVAPLAATTAFADTTTVPDNRNMRGNLFDIRSATSNHKGSLLNHTIETYSPWRSGDLRSTGRRPRIMCIYVWRERSDPRIEPDYQICAKLSKKKLRGYVFDVRAKRKTNHKVLIRRLDLESVTYSFQPSAIGNPRWYGWQAVTGFTGRGCRRERRFRYGCDDSAPTGCTQAHELTPGALPPEAPPQSCPRRT